MIDHPHPVLIIGAGMAGLTAARLLNEAQVPVLVLDKGRGVGGRMATRRFGGGRFDHGAQFFTSRDPRFAAAVAGWQKDGVVTEWAYGFGAGPSTAGHARYRGIAGMSAVPKHLAGTLDVRLRTRVTAVSRAADHWLVHTDAGETYRGQALLLTAPPPQSLALLQAGAVSLPAAVRDALHALTYDPCLALMATFDGPSKIPPPGGLPLAGGPIAWIADNHQKGISPDAYSITIHATPVYSREQWSGDDAVIAGDLFAAAAGWLHSDLLEWQLHRWRYSQPANTHAEPVLALPDHPALAFAGDAFGGPRVEGAFLSGVAAAERLLHAIGTAAHLRE